MAKYNFNQVTKLLEKIFKAGFIDDKSIIAIQLDDLEKIPDISSSDITILLELKKAIKTKKVIAFLSNGIEKQKEQVMGKDNLRKED